jgi:CheY-like chemotaxis protein
MHKLLLADDSVTIQRVIELTFSGEDVQVLAVNDGEQAIARIPLERPDVVLADIGMPRKGGYDVSAFVKGRADLAHIPVLLLAGAFEPVDQARAEHVKADGVLIKPFEPRHVIERVRELLTSVSHAAAVAPAAEATASGDTGAVQSLDDLFESLNQASYESATTDPATPSEGEPAPTAFGREPLVVGPPVAFEPMAAPPSNGATLDDYFDRLSAAFAQASAPGARPFQPVPERLDDLAPAAVPPRSDEEGTAEQWLAPAGTPLSPGRRMDDANPILEAVTALMAEAAENGSAKTAPAGWPQTGPQAAWQEGADAVAERVLARLVPEVAERLRQLVQQEIARAQHDVH